ncbi:potassium/proton antiporter [Halobacteriovorax sp. Y22]|uniref:potassium/proton antiporter n=1 Tax=Halobacteriovorax sp. Y22 TaxID=2505978 RepID=UPI001080FC1E|nr:potassium/proton antiporter [Halobacteriovorax sp. Y22]TGD48325.1 potassium/proton antiporter [Halobacteriovorax sp. Y22]
MEQFLNNFLLGSSILLLLSVVLSKSSSRFGLPVLILFLIIGMLAGSDGIGGINFSNFELTHSLSLVALCLIIFTGGFETPFNKIKRDFGRGVALSSLGVVFTTLLVGGFTHLITDIGILESLLIGAILSATDAAAVFSAFKDPNTQVGDVKNILRFESGSNDPMAYFLVSVLLGFIEQGIGDVKDTAFLLFSNPAIGLAGGWVIARAFILINNVIKLDYNGLYPPLTIAALFLGYSVTTKLGGNGFLAVYVFGMIIGNKKILHKNLLTLFFDGMTWLSQIGLFVMLGLLVFPSRLPSIAPTGLLIAVFLTFAARPISVFLCLVKSSFNLNEKIFVSWAGLKGATPIVFASFAATHMGERAHTIFDIVFFVVIISALIQGSTLKIMARKLGLIVEQEDEANFPVDLELLEQTKHGIVQLEIRETDFAVDNRVVDLGLPTGSVVLFIKRHGAFIIPDGATVFEKGDKILLVTKLKEELEKAQECFIKKKIEDLIEEVDDTEELKVA